MQPYSALAGHASAYFCAQDFRINQNGAQEGAAIYGDVDSNALDDVWGADVFLNSALDFFCADPEPPSALGAVACASGVACNELVGNVAENASGDPTGAIILLQTWGELAADRFRMHANHGTHLIRSVADDTLISGTHSTTRLSNCLLTDNETSASLIVQTPGEDFSSIEMDACTIARNAIAEGPVLELESTDATLTRSIFDQPGVPTVSIASIGDLAASQLLTNDASTLPPAADIVEGAPFFIDADHGDYHLRVDSTGVDFALEGDDEIGLDGMPRRVDQPGVPNIYGVQDLGPFEAQLACGPDGIYCNGFDPA
jgi:hypothetical protein